MSLFGCSFRAFSVILHFTNGNILYIHKIETTDIFSIAYFKDNPGEERAHSLISKLISFRPIFRTELRGHNYRQPSGFNESSLYILASIFIALMRDKTKIRMKRCSIVSPYRGTLP